MADGMELKNAGSVGRTADVFRVIFIYFKAFLSDPCFNDSFADSGAIWSGVVIAISIIAVWTPFSGREIKVQFKCRFGGARVFKIVRRYTQKLSGHVPGIMIVESQGDDNGQTFLIWTTPLASGWVYSTCDR
jgi:hypothetical protein